MNTWDSLDSDSTGTVRRDALILTIAPLSGFAEVNRCHCVDRHLHVLGIAVVDEGRAVGTGVAEEADIRLKRSNIIPSTDEEIS